MVALLVPFTKIDTPLSGSLFSSVTTPETEVAAKADADCNAVNSNTRNVNFNADRENFLPGEGQMIALM